MADILIILVVLSNLRLLTSGRMVSLIEWAGFQGLILGVFTLVSGRSHLTIDVALVGVGALIMKGIVFPKLLLHTTLELQGGREMEPYVGYIASTLIGLVALMLSLWLGTQLHIPGGEVSRLLVPGMLFTVFCGQFLMVARKKAISQVVGFLVMENGVFLLGVGTFYHTPFLVEIGAMLDMFVAILIWGVLIRNMNRAFHHIDTHELRRLRG